MTRALIRYEPWLSERLKADGPKVACTNCEGAGILDYETDEYAPPCPACNGTGSVPRYDSVEQWLRDSPNNEGGRHLIHTLTWTNDDGEEVLEGELTLTATQLLSLAVECKVIRHYRLTEELATALTFDRLQTYEADTADALAPLVLRSMGAPDAAQGDV